MNMRHSLIVKNMQHEVLMKGYGQQNPYPFYVTWTMLALINMTTSYWQSQSNAW